MKTYIHACAGAVGFLMVLVFMSSTIIAEVFGSHETIALVKGAILWGLLIMIPAMAIVGGSGFSLAAGRSDAPITAKKKRMPIIGLNGLLVLVPLAFLLNHRASSGQFDFTFYIMQAAELIAGAVNLTLMGMNFRDGLALTGRGKPSDTVKLVAIRKIASETIELQIERPGGYEHKAGQWLRLTVPDLADRDAKGASRPLSIVSAPHEPRLAVATRLSDSAFKQGLKNLPVGADLIITNANGNFVIAEESDRPLVFIAGGIGITPFISMIRHHTHIGNSRRVTLFYSNRGPGAAAYLSELQDLENANQNFNMVATITSPEDTSQEESNAWNGETGFIDHAMLVRHLSDVNLPVYYCVGPPAMVSSIQDMLESAGISTHDIIIESFAGY